MTTAGAAVPALVRGAPWRTSLLRRARSLQGGLTVLLATLLWHSSNFMFNSVSARLLGPSGYSELAATTALLYVASPLLLSVQTMTSRTFTVLLESGNGPTANAYLRRNIRVLGGVACVIAGGAFLLRDALSGLAHVASGYAVPVAVSGLAISLLTHSQRGALQGASLFNRFAASTATEATAKVVSAALLLLVVRRDVTSAVAAIPLAAGCTFAVNRLLLRPLTRRGGRSEVTHAQPAQLPTATVATFAALALLLSVDVITAKRYLPSAEAGVYAAVSLCGKTVFFATSAVALVLFPRFSRVGAKRLLRRGSAIVSAASLALVAIYFAAPAVVVAPLLGSGFGPAREYVGWMGLAFGLYGLMYLSAMYLLGQGRRIGAAALVLVAVVQVAALLFAHGSVRTIVFVQLTVFGVGAALLATAALAVREKHDRS
ncbi:MAG TPA: hypothetical protein VE982_01920 [Gaiellaceae bacterium]|nr:hypothetical protein [Gaiellaceae bacterium]